MKNKRLLKTIVGLAIAFAMTFTPFSGTYAMLVNPAGNGDGQVTETQATDATSEDAVSEETEPSQPEVTTEESEPAEQAEPEIEENVEPVEEVAEKAERTEYIWKDEKVKVTAVLSDAEAIPDDAELVAKAVTSKSDDYDYDAYMEALNKNSDSKYNGKNTLLYDVAFMKDGVEIQPESGTVSVTFEFLDKQLSKSIGAKKASDVNVIHLPLKNKIRDKYDTTADAKNIDAKDIVFEELTKKDNELAVSVKNEKVQFETSGFSVYAYTVDFEYTDPDTGKVYTYNLEGAGSITLKELAIILGITTKADADEFVKNVEDVKFSDENLVKVKKTFFRGWVLKSLAPFSSEELLTITMKDGTVIEVKVTDTQESTDLTNFLTNAVVSGAAQKPDGTYVVTPGTDYSIILSFAEDSSYQFKNEGNEEEGVLTYQMPAGIKIIKEQNEPMTINIVYKGRTYQVNATCNLSTDGLLKVKFDQTDPDYPRLVESTNVSFRYTYHAQFNGEAKEIKFSEDVERDIIFDEPEPGQAFANKTATYDETTGKFTYTIKVTAKGDVKKVNVKDTIAGDALIFNNDVHVSVDSSRYTDNHASKGFDYTFAEMSDGEVITITYTANVDFSKDRDGDGKITADQTKNTVTVDSDPGDPHNSEYSREIRYKYTVKKGGKEASTTEDGNKIIDWEIDYNPLAIVPVGGDKITDNISADSVDYMKYYGDGITVKVYDRSGHLVGTRNIDYDDLNPHTYTDTKQTWTYTIPTSDDKPYSYVITYQTVVDMSKVNGGGTAVTLDNTANDDHGTVNVGPDNEISVIKDVESFTTEEVNWVSTLTVPDKGLTKAVVTDYLPHIWLNGANHYDLYKDRSLDIQGLLPGESYSVSEETDRVIITFYKDSAKQELGLQATEGGHTITVRLTTKVDQEWLQKGYETSGYEQDHTNKIVFNGKEDTAKVTYGKPDVKKTGEKSGDSSFKYTVVIAGASELPITVKDTFDTSLLEVDTSKSGSWDHMRIWGGNQWSQDTGRIPVSYTDDSDGITLTANSVPMQPDGNYYPYYKIVYYLKLKDGVDLEQLAIANGGEHHLINKALWAGHETEFDYKTEYDYLDKKLLNAGQIGGTNRTAQYKITFNSAKATLNGGEPMVMTDVLSSNLSLDYSSIRITTDPAVDNVPYTISGGKDEYGHDNGTTVATYTVPDSTKVVITYTAHVRGNGTQKIVNKVSVNGRDETSEDTEDYGAADEGEGAIPSLKIVKVDGYDANKKLSGVKFKIFAENPNLEFKEGVKELVLTTNKNGEIILDGENYRFYFNERYHIQEIEALEDYGLISFDYLVTMTNDMALVDYGDYIYYYSDTMQIKNWPLEGLVVEKQVDSDDPKDNERYYTFRVSILNDDGTVNTNYNEKNGDDTFVNGVVEFQIKDKEHKMFWGFKKGTKYKVEELDANGFATDVTYNIFDEEGNVTEVKTDKDTTSHIGELTQEDEVIVFKNSKHNEKGSLKIKKTVTENNQAPSAAAKVKLAGTYTFTLYTNEECKTPYTVNGQPKTVTLTIPDTGAAVTSEEVKDLPAGDYWIKETSPTNGSSPVTNPVKVTVVAGKTGEEAVIAKFTNNLPTGKVTLKGAKDIEGRPFKEGDSATMKVEAVTEGAPLPDPAVLTINPTSGTRATFQFADIEYDLSMIPEGQESKTFTYKVTESAYSMQGVGEKDSTEYTVTVKISDNGDGTLKVEKSENAESLNFTNTYGATGKVTLKGAKDIEGRPFKSGDSATMKIEAVTTGAPMPAQDTITLNPTEGTSATFQFGDINYKLSDIPKGADSATFKYKVTESAYSMQGVGEKDSTEYTVTVKISDNGDGTLKVEKSDNATALNFKNKYNAKGKVTLSGKKDIEGRPFKSGDSATMKVEAITTGAPLPDPAELTIQPTGGTSATFQFADIEYTLSMIPEGATSKTFEYKVTESAYSMQGVGEKDSTEYTVTVKISDNGDGTLKVEKSDNATALNFKNKYNATGKATLKGEKDITGRPFKAGDSATMKIEAVTPGAPMPAQDTITLNPTEGTSATFQFGDISYKLSDIPKGADSATFKYKVTESAYSMQGVGEKDSTEYTVTVKISDNGDGTIKVEKSENAESLVFINTYEAKGTVTLSGKKDIEGRPFKAGDSATMKIEAVTPGAPMPPEDTVTVEPTEGQTAVIEFKPISYDLSMIPKGQDSATFKYKVTESAYTMEGVAEKDSTEYTVTVKISDNGDGTLKVEKSDNATALNFKNKYAATGKATLKGEKDITGRPFKDGDSATMKIEAVTPGAPMPEQDTITLNPTGGKSATFQFGDIEYDLSDIPKDATSKTFEYKVTESAYSMQGVGEKDSTEYTVTVKISDNGDGTLKVEKSDNATALNFKNKYDAKGIATLKGAKDIEGRPFKSGDSATMKIEAVTTGAPLPNPAELTIQPTGGTSETFQFADIEYTLSMIPEGAKSKTFEYKVTESAYSMQGVGEKDSTEYTVTVKISDNGDGTLKVEKSENAESLKFTNTYDAKGSIPLKGTKEFKFGSFDKAKTNGAEFTFSVYTKGDFDYAVDHGLFTRERDRNDQEFINDLQGKAVLTASTTGAQLDSGNAVFNFKTADGKDLEYTLADIKGGEIVDGHLTKEFDYVVVEDIPKTAVKKTVGDSTFYYDSTSNIKYDARVYHVTITVTDNGTGTLDVRTKAGDEGPLTFDFVNEKIYTKLLLTKNIDSLVTGDTEGELTNVTCVFKVSYTDPILGRAVSRTVSVQFDATKVSAETPLVDKIPIDATDLRVDEVYSVDYTGKVIQGVAVRGVDKDTGLPLWTVEFDNKRKGDITGSGVINSVKKNGDGFVITNRRDSTGKNPSPPGIADDNQTPQGEN